MDSISNTLDAGNYLAASATANGLVDSLAERFATDREPAIKPSELSEDEFKILVERETAKSVEAGKDFESMFISLMLKEMRNTLENGEGGLFGGEQSDTFGAMFDQFMGEHLADSSPLGIAHVITADMIKRSRGATLNEAVNSAQAIEGYEKNKPAAKAVAEPSETNVSPEG
ncbi:MAG: Rod binding domain-containing protein [Mariniblastus sp.]|jgi:Rod binding domain-containing protein